MQDFVKELKAQLKNAVPTEQILSAFAGILRSNGVENPSITLNAIKSKGLLGNEIGTAIRITGALDGKDLNLHRQEFFKSGKAEVLQMENISSERVAVPVVQHVERGMSTIEINGTMPHVLGYTSQETYKAGQKLVDISNTASKLLTDTLRDPLGHMSKPSDPFKPAQERGNIEAEKSKEDDLELSS